MYDDQVSMRCAVCIDAGDNFRVPKNRFITGSKNLRFSTVAGHKKSISHVNALKVVASWAKAVQKTSISHKMVIPLNEALRKQIERKFRNIHALIMNNRPISDFKMNLISLKVMIMEPPTTTQLQLQLFLKVHFRCRKDKDD